MEEEEEERRLLPSKILESNQVGLTKVHSKFKELKIVGDGWLDQVTQRRGVCKHRRRSHRDWLEGLGGAPWEGESQPLPNLSFVGADLWGYLATCLRSFSRLGEKVTRMPVQLYSAQCMLHKNLLPFLLHLSLLPSLLPFLPPSSLLSFLPLVVQQIFWLTELLCPLCLSKPSLRH